MFKIKRWKLAVASIGGAMAIAIPLALTAGATQTFTPDNLPLTLLSQSNNIITLGWDAYPGYGYLFKTKADSNSDWVVVSRTNDPTRTSVRFSKGSYAYGVSALAEGAIGTYSPSSPPPVDTQAPSDPTGLTSSNVTDTSFDVSWTASTDNVGVTGYDVLLNNSAVQTVNATSYSFSEKTCNTAYTVGVRAVDAAGNRSNVSNLSLQTSACPPPPPGNDLIVDGSWTCDKAVNYDLVRVTNHGSGDVVRLASGCTGRIGRLESIGAVNGDAIKIQNSDSNAAHDLVIESGFASCAGPSTDGTHQDGVQGMGGKNITFRNFVFDCYGGGGGNFFIQRAGSGATTPTNIVCDHCALGPRHPNQVNLGTSVGAGVSNSLVCQPLSGRNWFQTDSSAQQVVNENNSVVPSNDPRCATTSTLSSWATS